MTKILIITAIISLILWNGARNIKLDLHDYISGYARAVKRFSLTFLLIFLISIIWLIIIW